MIKLIFLFLFSLSLFARDFTVSSYNVENLFDLKKDKSDYNEYVPNQKSNWNTKTFNIKVNNLIKVLKELDSDIIGLQEIENITLLKTLQKRLPQYKYISFAKYKNSSVGVGFLSKFKIISSKSINVKFSNKIFRPILESTFRIENYEFKVFNNHWPSKRVKESYRLKYAKRLYDRISSLAKDYDYILLGDFNSNYDEFKTIYHEKRLNNTDSITGINHILNTISNKRFVTYDDILSRGENLNYNLWLDLPYEKRFSNKYRGRNNTPDNIIISPALFDNKKISYKLKSFKVFKPSYLYKNGKIIRWQMKNRVHKGRGYSDHLPITATFTTNKEEKNPLKKLKKIKIDKISQLYNKTKLVENVFLKNVIVLYKNKDSAIIKQKNDRAIYIYKNAKNLKEGYSYDIEVSQIGNYHGLKEIFGFDIKNENGYVKDYKKFYKKTSTNIFDLKNQNEVITKLEGFYKKGYFYFKNNGSEKKVKIYSKNRAYLPKNSSKIKINRAHIGYYKSKVQLIVYQGDDISVD